MTDAGSKENQGLEIQSSLNPVSLKRNFLWTASSQAVYALSQLGIIIALAKIGGPTSVGAFTLGTAIATPIVLFTNMQLKALQASDARSDFEFPNYVSLRAVTSPLAFLSIIVVALIAGYSAYVAAVIAVIAVSKCIESLSDVLYGLFQKQEWFDKTSISVMIRSCASLLTVVVVLYATHSVLLALLGMAISWSLVLVVYDVSRAKELLASYNHLRRYAATRTWFRFDRFRISALARMAFPMGIVTMLVSLNLNIPRLIIERDLGIRQLGFFGAMAYPVLAGGLAVFALCEAAIPRLSRDFANAPRQFVRVWLRLLFAALVIAIAGVTIVWLWGSDLLRIAYGPAYQQYGTVFTWLMIGAGFGYLGSVNGYVLTAARRLKIQVPLFAIITAVTFVGSLVLVPRSGLVGAGQAMAIAGLVYAVLAGGAAAIAVVSRRKAVTPVVPEQTGSPSIPLNRLSSESLNEA